MSAPPEKTPFSAHCGDCGYEWVVAWLPMEVSKVAALAKAARCPLCASEKVLVAASR